MRLLLEVKMDNAAFEVDTEFEAARILRGYADDIIDRGLREMTLYDVNGNNVGRARVLED